MKYMRHTLVLLVAPTLILAGCSSPTAGVPTPHGTPPSLIVPTSAATIEASSALAAPTASEVERVASDFERMNGARLGVRSVTDVRMAQDASGRWWASAVVAPQGDGNTTFYALDPAPRTYVYRDGTAWRLFYIGTLDQGVLPQDLVGKL